MTKRGIAQVRLDQQSQIDIWWEDWNISPLHQPSDYYKGAAFRVNTVEFYV